MILASSVLRNHLSIGPYSPYLFFNGLSIVSGHHLFYSMCLYCIVVCWWLMLFSKRYIVYSIRYTVYSIKLFCLFISWLASALPYLHEMYAFRWSRISSNSNYSYSSSYPCSISMAAAPGRSLWRSAKGWLDRAPLQLKREARSTQWPSTSQSLGDFGVHAFYASLLGNWKKMFL